MNPALETLMLAFSAENGPAIPLSALFLGAQPHPALHKWPDVTGWQPFKPAADAWDRAGFARIDELPDGKWPVVLVLPGKSRAETLLWFALAKDRLQPGGRIVAAMPNTAGASRFEKELAQAAGNITSIQKHKCRAFHAVDDGSWNRETLNAWRSLGGFREIAGTRYLTQAGVFSSEHIDPGSLLLGQHLPASLHGRIADLGAGWGYLSDVALDRCPGIERIDLYEADSRALACAKRNLARHLPTENPLKSELRNPKAIGEEATKDYTDFTDSELQEHPMTNPSNSSKSVSICEICGSNSVLQLSSAVCHICDEPRVRFHWHDVTRGLPETYDAIVMNPPFHSGQHTDVDLGRAFLTNAAAALKRHGKLLLVANRQLPYEAVLDSLRFAWRKVAEDRTYKVISAEKR